MTYFPMRIRLTATGEEMVCLNGGQIPQGVSFRVLEIKSLCEDFPDVVKTPIDAREIVSQAVSRHV